MRDVKNWPKKIYLQCCDDPDCDCDYVTNFEMTWCADKINKHDVKYIRADLVHENSELLEAENET